ncbi:MAG: Uncharacterized protein G01um101418_754 [Parcubacteria group bacterium Gr01-1014_18]|nr:MAG: Uncharacterized protein Greene041636_776 [Parcubacteria group bacterium Greene0416_36]TSC80119.1 MAG: Uncharacterized protein G01um101418_754 [Parcubacteria group bacterium Gr01-1014_18]TSC99333.1 MAG: Uncharacterized protein Greene101420_261 [Parcubacteria group bacterium Greene1014_20]TSD06830.1 MAG: Uncharacterized protein Greene07142_564 [Parcubacteria group bacterium Greene0714_2]
MTFRKKLSILGGVFFAVVLGAVIYVHTIAAKEVYTLAMDAKAALEKIKYLAMERNWKESRANAAFAENNFKKAHDIVAGMRLVYWIPWVSTQAKAGRDLLEIGFLVSSAVEKGFGVVENVTEGLKIMPETKYSDIPTETRRTVLAKIQASRPVLYSIEENISRSVGILERLPFDLLWGPIAEKVTPVREYLPTLRDLSQNIGPLFDFFPYYAGYPESRKYLFLLQNYNELRPTGGFIGTYGFVKMDQGAVTELDTDNVYNLDEPAKGKIKVAAPAPLQRYLNSRDLFFRDSNWSPDYIESARLAQWFYNAEKGKTEQIDAVIAITPFIIARFLAIVGPVTLDGVQFTKDNLADRLEDRVGKEYAEKGIATSARKEIMTDLAIEIYKRFLELPSIRWLELPKALFDSLKEKHVLVYVENPQAASFLRSRNWDGKMISTLGDFWMAVDSNLASLKTDAYIDRSSKYSVTLKDDHWEALLELTYFNRGQFTWKTTRLRSYTRVYVPLGSSFIAATGAMDIDRSSKKGEVSVGDELGKTVFGAFIAIEPQETKSLTFRYRLPDSIGAQLDKGSYSLYIQKQSGLHVPPSEILIDRPGKLKNWTLSSGKMEEKDGKIVIHTDRRMDQEVNLEWE